ncbi:MAG: response regulator transcription factor [Acidobacteriaceae bacterium]|nr:response regulator transcription factor [Acidobacteriaceae bacterium]MBV9501847.1 response regulator transcription factor [Acidobacteriaceae bacterium]
MEPIRVLLANSHPLIRNNLRLLLEREQDFLIVGEAANGREAVVLTDYRHPDVVLLDIHLPYVDGLAAAREISSRNKRAGIVFVTANPDLEYASESFKAGGRGYVLADSAQVELARAVRVVARGGSFLSPIIAAQLIEDYERRHLGDEKRTSVRDRQLVRLLAEGYDEGEIARHLNSCVEFIRHDCQNVKRLLLEAGMPEITQHARSRVT